MAISYSARRENFKNSGAGTVGMPSVKRATKSVAIQMLLVAVCLGVLCGSARAQTAADFKVEVVVADQGQKQRSSAYWLALDRVLRRNMPDAITDSDQRAKVLREASRYVLSFRYRRFDTASDGARLSTRAVRDGAQPDSVIVVSFPAELESILRQQAASSAVVVTSEDQSTAPAADILALVAVDQEATQFMIGGKRGKKFQSRMAQLGANNALSFKFPLLNRADKELLAPADVLFDQTEKLDAIMARYQTDRRLTAALFRLSEQVWQTEWRYVVAGQVVQTLNLTTRTLDEALVTALSELGDSGAGYSPNSYLGQSTAFQRDGIALRIENINSLAAYQRVLKSLQQIDTALVTESLEPGAIVFRAPQSTLSSMQQSIARMPELRLLSTGAVTGAELVAQFRP